MPSEISLGFSLAESSLSLSSSRGISSTSFGISSVSSAGLSSASSGGLSSISSAGLPQLTSSSSQSITSSSTSKSSQSISSASSTTSSKGFSSSASSIGTSSSLTSSSPYTESSSSSYTRSSSSSCSSSCSSHCTSSPSSGDWYPCCLNCYPCTTWYASFKSAPDDQDAVDSTWWTVVSGDWLQGQPYGTNQNALYTADDGAIIVANGGLPGYIATDIASRLQPSATVRVIFGYNSPTDYYFLQIKEHNGVFTPTGSYSAEVTLGKSDGSTLGWCVRKFNNWLTPCDIAIYFDSNYGRMIATISPATGGSASLTASMSGLSGGECGFATTSLNGGFLAVDTFRLQQNADDDALCSALDIPSYCGGCYGLCEYPFRSENVNMRADFNGTEYSLAFRHTFCQFGFLYIPCECLWEYNSQSFSLHVWLGHYGGVGVETMQLQLKARAWTPTIQAVYNGPIITGDTTRKKHALEDLFGTVGVSVTLNKTSGDPSYPATFTVWINAGEYCFS